MRITYNDIKSACAGRDINVIKQQAMDTITAINARQFDAQDSAPFWYASAKFWHCSVLSCLSRRDLKMAWTSAKGRTRALKELNKHV